jgi:hypothetical protein
MLIHRFEILIQHRAWSVPIPISLREKTGDATDFASAIISRPGRTEERLSYSKSALARALAAWSFTLPAEKLPRAISDVFKSVFFQVLPRRNKTVFVGAQLANGIKDPASSFYIPPPSDVIAKWLLMAAHQQKHINSVLNRALYQFLVLLTVHPFLDGNGRAARFCLCAAFYQAGWSAVDTAAILQEFFGSDSTNGMYLLADTQISGDPNRFLSQWRRLIEQAECTDGVAIPGNSHLPISLLAKERSDLTVAADLHVRHF